MAAALPMALTSLRATAITGERFKFSRKRIRFQLYREAQKQKRQPWAAALQTFS